MTNFFKKLGLGLKKSSEQISEGLNNLFVRKKIDEQTLQDLEDTLLSSDMGIAATTKIISDFSKEKFGKECDEMQIKSALSAKIAELLKPCEKEFVIDGTKKPFVILMAGVNGAGKTTTIGKLAAKFQENVHFFGKKPQISFIAGDTFRAAAVEQLKVWGERNKVRVFFGENGCDAAGLCFDGLNEAIKQNDDIVFIDTAGRLQNKAGLMDELKKVVRVIKKVIPDAPHETLLTIDATTGQNALSQVEIFNNEIGLSGLIITKLDGTSKGGILVAISEKNKLPIYFIGVGEKTEDIDAFKSDDFAKGLLGL